MRPVAHSWCLIVLVWTGLPGLAYGAGLRNLDDGWLLTAADQQRTVAAVMHPLDAEPGLRIWGQVGQAHLFGMPELPVLHVAGGMMWQYGRWTWRLDVRWQRTGRDLFREDIWGLHLETGVRWRVGLRLSGRSLAFEGQAAGAYLQPAVAGVVPLSWLGLPTARLELQTVLLDPPLRFGRPGRAALLRFICPGPPLGVAVALDELPDGTLAVGLDVLVRVATGIGFSVRLDPATGAMGPSTVWRKGPLLVRTSHVVHPDLGITHRFAVVGGCLEAAR